MGMDMEMEMDMDPAQAMEYGCKETISHRLEEEMDHQQEMEGMSPGGHDESGMSPEGVAGHHEMDEGQHH
jgi:hypothetical protein